ncbi:hypothetical protein DM02DRAFT_514823, partial [Periconia macrospinosa]
WSVLIVSVRFYTRAVYIRSPGKDDYAMVAALIFTIGYLACIWVLNSAGLALSSSVLTIDQMITQTKTVLAVEILYYLAVAWIKLSICFCYLRIAAVPSFKLATIYTVWFLAIFCGVCIICTLTQCLPLHKMWDFTGTVQGKCVNTTALFYATSSINIITDFWILCLPAPTLLRIQRPKHEKLALIVVFSLGAFSCIASIVRLHSIRIYTDSEDPFYDSVPVNLWSMVEVNMGIWCASIPALKALVTYHQRKATTQDTNSSYQYHGSGMSGKGASANQPSIAEVAHRDDTMASISDDDDSVPGGDGYRMTRMDSEMPRRAGRESDEGPVQDPAQVSRKKSSGGDSTWSCAESQRDMYPATAEDRV